MRKHNFDFVHDLYTPKEETAAFAVLCGQMGGDFIKTTERKRTVETYGKLLGICIVFGLNRFVLRLLCESDARTDEVIVYMSREGKKLEVVEGWIFGAVENIPDAQLKAAALEVWNARVREFGTQDFDIIKLYHKSH